LAARSRPAPRSRRHHVADNYVTKPLSWRTERWSTRPDRAQERGGLGSSPHFFENNWQAGSPGVRERVHVRNQTAVHCARSITSPSSRPSCVTALRYQDPWDGTTTTRANRPAILIRNNRLSTSTAWPGAAAILRGMTDGRRTHGSTTTPLSGTRLRISHIDGPACALVRLTTTVPYVSYGIAGTGHGSGNTHRRVLAMLDITRRGRRGTNGQRASARQQSFPPPPIRDPVVSFEGGDYR